LLSFIREQYQDSRKLFEKLQNSGLELHLSVDKQKPDQGLYLYQQRGLDHYLITGKGFEILLEEHAQETLSLGDQYICCIIECHGNQSKKRLAQIEKIIREFYQPKRQVVAHVIERVEVYSGGETLFLEEKRTIHPDGLGNLNI